MKMNLIKKLNIWAILVPIISLVIFDLTYFVVLIVNLFDILVILLNIKYYKKNENKTGISSNIILLFIIFSMLSILLALFSLNSIHILQTTLLIVGNIGIVMLLIISDKEREYTIKKVFAYFLYIVVFLCLYGIILRVFGNQYITEVSANEYIQKLSLGGISFTQSACGDPTFGFMVGSLTNNPNTLSYFCIIALAIKLFYKSNKKIHGVIEYIALIIGLFISGSRLAIILFPITLILFYIYKKVQKKENRIIPIILLGMFAIGCFALLNIDYFTNKIDLNGRDITWTVAIEEIQNVNLIGGGLGSDNQLISEKTGIDASMHNSYLSFFVNYGIIISIGFLSFIIVTLVTRFKVVYLEKNKALCYILFILMLIMALSESVFFVYGSYQYLFFYIMFHLYIVNKEKKDDNNIYTNI
ncbi:MAG: O-antigen ligase family protein [Clostridia bacterium]|nr:O-antigen ligase family protein [Clostridia bacterium]